MLNVESGRQSDVGNSDRKGVSRIERTVGGQWTQTANEEIKHRTCMVSNKVPHLHGVRQSGRSVASCKLKKRRRGVKPIILTSTTPVTTTCPKTTYV